MKNLFAFAKSTRSVAVILCFLLLFLIVGLSAFAKEPSERILTLVGPVITLVVSSYFVKRDDSTLPPNTSVRQETVSTTKSTQIATPDESATPPIVHPTETI